MDRKEIIEKIWEELDNYFENSELEYDTWAEKINLEEPNISWDMFKSEESKAILLDVVQHHNAVHWLLYGDDDMKNEFEEMLDSYISKEEEEKIYKEAIDFLIKKKIIKD